MKIKIDNKTRLMYVVFLFVLLGMIGITSVITVQVGVVYSKKTIQSSGFSIVDNNINLSEADASFIGDAVERSAGENIDILGDMNGDGYDDILIGCYANRSTNFYGEAHIFFGSNKDLKRNINVTNSNITLKEQPDWDGTSMNVKGIGDVNGDGCDDILAGIPGDDTHGSGRGQSYLFFGKKSGWPSEMNLSDASASFYGEHKNDGAGTNLAGVGDVNNDTYDDFIIGARKNDDGGTDAGKVYLILGKASGWTHDVSLSTANASFIGEAPSDYLGIKLTKGIGDVNGDGYNDILIPTRYNDEGGNLAGQVYLIFGRKTGWKKNVDISTVNASFIGEFSGDAAGQAAGIIGDINRDGYADISIGAFNNDEGGEYAGKAYIILGKASEWSMDISLSEADMAVIGDNTQMRFGYSIARLRDVNNDTYDDLIIGAPGIGGPNRGHSYLLLGKASGWSGTHSISNAADIIFSGEEEGDESGTDISGGGDVNGDSKDDILIGAPKNDAGGDDAGKVYLFFDFSTQILPLLLLPPEEPSTIDVWLPVIITVPIVSVAAVVAVVLIYMRKKK